MKNYWIKKRNRKKQFILLYNLDAQAQPVLLVQEELVGAVFTWVATNPTVVHGVVLVDGNMDILYQQWGMLYIMAAGDTIRLDFSFA